MRYRSYIKVLSIVIILSNLLLLILPNRAYDQAKTPIKTPIMIFVDDFDPIGKIPDEIMHFVNGGSFWLGTALEKITDPQRLPIFKVVERKKINKILEEAGGIQQKLSTVFDQPKVRERLNAEGAQYLIFTVCAPMGRGRVRFDSRMVKVKDVAFQISEFSIASRDDIDPLQPLADKLAESFMRTVSPKTRMEDKGKLQFLGLTVTSDPKNPNPHTELVKATMLSSLIEAFRDCQKESKPRCSIFDFETSDCKNIAPQLPSDMDYFMTATMLTEGNKIRVIVMIYNLTSIPQCNIFTSIPHDIDDSLDLNMARTAAKSIIDTFMQKLKESSQVTDKEKAQDH